MIVKSGDFEKSYEEKCAHFEGRGRQPAFEDAVADAIRRIERSPAGFPMNPHLQIPHVRSTRVGEKGEFGTIIFKHDEETENTTLLGLFSKSANIWNKGY